MKTTTSHKKKTHIMVVIMKKEFVLKKLSKSKLQVLLQHSKRAYQAGIWCTSEHSEQHASTPEGWGWTLDEDSQLWVPVWNILPVASRPVVNLLNAYVCGGGGADTPNPILFPVCLPLVSTSYAGCNKTRV